MNATVGDRMHFKSHAVGVAERVAEVVEVHGDEGEPPYLVRYPDGHESLVYPGPDCVVEESGAAPR